MGKLSPDQIRIEAFRDPTSGELVAINNRGLAALSKAGFQPTWVELREPTKDEANRLVDRMVIPGGTLPSNQIAVTPGRKDLEILEIISLPKR